MYGHNVSYFEFVQLLGILRVSIIAHIQTRQHLREKSHKQELILINNYFILFKSLAELISKVSIPSK